MPDQPTRGAACAATSCYAVIYIGREFAEAGGLMSHGCAGGPTDIVTRIMGQYLSERLGQQFIIDNRRAAGDIVGTQATRS